MKTFQRLMMCFRRLPGIGPKQAERLTVYILRASNSEVASLTSALMEAKERIHPCRECQNFGEEDLCEICQDPERDAAMVCVVGEPSDVAALERSRSYRGLYHVLHGSISPLEGIGPESLRIRELLERVRRENGKLKEIILATNPDTEGEATALYLGKILKSFPVRVSRIAQGVPLGGDLDYMDERTLSHAISDRKEL